LAISFEGLLVLETIIIMGVFALLYFRGRAKEGNKGSTTNISPRLVPVLLLFALGAAYLLTPQVATSRLIFFLGESLVLSATTLLVFRSDNPKSATTAILLVIGINILNGLMTKMVLGGVVWQQDERGYLLNALQIGSTGSYNSILSGYFQVPAVPELLYMLSSITSLPLGVTLTIVSSIFMMLFQATVFLATGYVTRNLKVAFMIQVFILFVPRLTLVQTVIPETYSLILAALSIFIIMKVVSKDSLSPTRDFVVAMLLYGGAVLGHPSGAVLVLTFMVLTVLVYSQKLTISRVGYRLEVSSASKGYPLSRILLLITTVAAAAYWISIPQVTGELTANLSTFLTAFSVTVSRAKPTGVSYTPLYTESGLQYTLPWGLPVALSAAYYISKAIRKKSEDWSQRDLMGAVCFVGGALLIVGSLVFLIGTPSSGADRYLGSPGYILVLFSLAAPFTSLFADRQSKLLPIAFLVLLLTMIAVGPSVPDITPDSHAAIFEPPTMSSIQFYSSALSAFPPNSVVAAEKNFVPPITMSALTESNLTIEYSSSYKNTRDLLGAIAAGTDSVNLHPGTLFVVDDSLLPGFLRNSANTSNIYMSSVDFVVVGSPQNRTLP
jgi:hypothetical protein